MARQRRGQSQASGPAAKGQGRQNDQSFPGSPNAGRIETFEGLCACRASELGDNRGQPKKAVRRKVRVWRALGCAIQSRLAAGWASQETRAAVGGSATAPAPPAVEQSKALPSADQVNVRAMLARHGRRDRSTNGITCRPVFPTASQRITSVLPVIAGSRSGMRPSLTSPAA
jgi:hypothetical protein